MMACGDAVPRCTAPTLPEPEGQHLPRPLFPLPSGMMTPKKRTTRRRRTRRKRSGLRRPLSRHTAPDRAAATATPPPSWLRPSPPCIARKEKGGRVPHLLPPLGRLWPRGSVRRYGGELGTRMAPQEPYEPPARLPSLVPATPERCLRAAPTGQRLPLSRSPPTAAAGPLTGAPRPVL